MAKQSELKLPPSVEPDSLRARRLQRLHAKGRLRSEEITDTDTGERKAKLYREGLDERVAVPSLAAEQDPDNDEGVRYVWPEDEAKERRRYELEKAWQEFASENGLDVTNPEMSVAIQRMTLPGREDPTAEHAEMFALYNGLRARFRSENADLYADEDEEE